MPYWTLVFLLLAIVAAAFGVSDISGAASTTAQILFVVFLGLFSVSFITAVAQRRRLRGNSQAPRNSP